MPTDGWSRHDRDGVTVVCCEPLFGISGCGHAFSTRCGPGNDDFDLGGPGDVSETIETRRSEFCSAAGFAGARPSLLHQVHGNRVLPMNELPMTGTVEADGIFATKSASRDRVCAVRTADCVPLLLADRDGRAVAAVHAGWRGTASGIVGQAVERLGESGAAPRNLLAALGPAIGPCCYEVGGEVVDAVATASGVAADAVAIAGDKARGPRLDLRRAVALQLQRVGLAPEAIRTAPWCTACDEALFFSYRRDGAPAGRLMACIGWTSDRRPSLTTAPR